MAVLTAPLVHFEPMVGDQIGLAFGGIGPDAVIPAQRELTLNRPWSSAGNREPPPLQNQFVLEPTLTIAWGMGRPVSAASARPSTIVAGWRTYRRSFGFPGRSSGSGCCAGEAGVATCRGTRSSRGRFRRA